MNIDDFYYKKIQLCNKRNFKNVLNITFLALNFPNGKKIFKKNVSKRAKKKRKGN